MTIQSSIDLGSMTDGPRAADPTVANSAPQIELPEIREVSGKVAGRVSAPEAEALPPLR
jgi:hypothetical protein